MFDSIATARGVSITYARGGVSESLTALPGSTVFEHVADSGAVSSHKSRDYLVRADTLALDESAVLPELGDTITEGGAVYAVHSPDGGNCFAWADPEHVILRIFTSAKEG